MSSLFKEHFEQPASTRDLRAFEAAGDRAGEWLEGRTVWCATSLPGARGAAERLRDRVAGAGADAAAASVPLEAEERLLELGKRVDEMLGGAGASADAALGRADQEAYAEAAMRGEDLLGAGVGADDVVVVHDALSALVIQAARERGAHAAWRVRLRGSSRPSARQAVEFIRGLTPGIDAFILTWRERGTGGELLESVAAAMPSTGIVATKEFPTRFSGDAPRRLAWRMALAEIVCSDRDECVGGTLHPRPTIAVR